MKINLYVCMYVQSCMAACQITQFLPSDLGLNVPSVNNDLQ